MTSRFEFPRSTPGAQGIAVAGIDNFLNALSEQNLEMHGMMLQRHGHVVAETWAAPYAADQIHQLNSLTKSFASTAMGLVVDRGFVSVDDLVVDFFPEQRPVELDAHWSTMRVHDILTMNTGHDGDALGRGRAIDPDDWTRGVLQVPCVAAPGTKFAYNGGASYLICAIVKKVSGKTVAELMQEHIFSKLGINEYIWQHSPQDVHNGAYGLHLKVEDILRLGTLYLNKGNWQGEQLVSESWVEEATKKQVESVMAPDGTMTDWDQGYGYQFWRCRHGIYRGDGAFGQYILVFPEYDAVFACHSGVDNQRMPKILDLVWEHILPSMGDKPIANDSGISQGLAVAALEGAGAAQLVNKSYAVAGVSDGPELAGNGMSACTVYATETSVEFSLTQFDKIFSFTAGLGEWISGRSAFLLESEGAVSARAVWTDADTLSIELRHILLPFPCRFEWQRNGNNNQKSSLKIKRRGMPGWPGVDVELTLSAS